MEMSSYMAGVFDLDLDVETVTVADSDDDDIIEVDEVPIYQHARVIHNNLKDHI